MFVDTYDKFNGKILAMFFEINISVSLKNVCRVNAFNILS